MKGVCKIQYMATNSWRAKRCDEDSAASVVCFWYYLKKQHLHTFISVLLYSQYFCMSVRDPVNEIQKQINGNEVLFLINSAIQYTILSFAREGEACLGHFTLFNKNISKGPLSVQWHESRGPDIHTENGAMGWNHSRNGQSQAVQKGHRIACWSCSV